MIDMMDVDTIIATQQIFAKAWEIATILSTLAP